MGENPSEAIHILLVAGSPEPSSPELVAGVAHECDLVVAVDRGAESCRAAGVVPDAFCGDADSIDEETMAWVRESVDDQSVYPREKDDTDLGLAFECAGRLADAADAGEWEAVVTCASGGRPDHALGVMGVLARNVAHAPMLIENDFECLILSPSGRASWSLGEAGRGKTFSLIPLADSVVTEENMYWELDHELLETLSERGVSNLVTTGFARVEVHEGVAAAFLLW